MNRYIALLRGVNISGKNKLSMAELKTGLQKMGLKEVVTYLNSGNVIFSSEIESCSLLAERIKQMIMETVQLDIPVFVIRQEELQEILTHAPEWWGNSSKEEKGSSLELYDNLIFLLPPLTFQELCEELGSPEDEYEKIFEYKNTVFWSFNRMQYQKTNWWSKTASTKVSVRITIRTANTVRKLAAA